MKSVSVLISLTVTICYGMSVSPDKEGEQQRLEKPVRQVNKENAEEFVINLLPLKILLEYQLRNREELQQISPEQEFHFKEELQGDFTTENLKSFPGVLRNENNMKELCEIDLMKNLTKSEISAILSSSENTKDSLSNERLKTIYNSLKNCFFVKARNNKLWGPLWHCLNRLFLFFVFN